MLALIVTYDNYFLFVPFILFSLLFSVFSGFFIEPFNDAIFIAIGCTLRRIIFSVFLQVYNIDF